MKIVKGVLTYTLILIGIILCAGVLLFAAMAFLNFSVFGYRVVLSKQGEVLKSTNELATIDGGGIKHIEVVIKSNNYDVIILPAETDLQLKKIDVYYKDCGFGLVSNGDKLNTKDGVKSILNISYENEGNKIIIELITPQGTLNYRDSYLLVKLPHTVSDTNYEYGISVNSGKGDINIKPNKNSSGLTKEDLGILNINSLKVETTSGNLNLYGLKSSDQTIKYDHDKTDNNGNVVKDNDGNVIKETELTTSFANFSTLELKTDNGKFDFRKQNIKVSSVIKIESNRGDFYFKHFIGGFTTKGENLVFEAESINTYIDESPRSYLYNCPNGTLRIGTLSVKNSIAEIITQYGKVNIGTMLGDLSIQTTYGNTTIGETRSNVVDITTTHGDITVKSVTKKDGHTGTIAARSTYGDITVGAREYKLDDQKRPTKDYTDYGYAGKGWFTNKSGKINIRYTGNDINNNETRILTVSGSVIAEGLKGQVNATATGNANMTLNFVKVPNLSDNDSETESTITIGTGKLNINVPTITTGDNASYGFIIDYVTKNGSKLEIFNMSTSALLLEKNATAEKDSNNNIKPGTDNRYKNYESGNKFVFVIRSEGGKADLRVG